jgi:hypothetical protein
MRFATIRRTFASDVVTPIFVGALLLLVLSGFGCRDSAPDDVIVEEETTAAIVFVKTKGEETLNRSWAVGNLYKLSPISPEGVVTPITNFVDASISDPCVSFDGKKILFSMRPPGGGNRNIYEINANGTGLRQVTSGGGHDFDPLYLPDGRILFTSSRARHMDEYNHAPAENMYLCDADGSNLTQVSFNMSDDFDPTLDAEGHVVYTRWEHFGTVNRFPLFIANPDGTAPFHKYGPHNRNFFHPQPTVDGRLIAIESTMIEEDAGPIVVLKLESGPADPTQGNTDLYWNVLTPNVNTDGEPWPYGAFKYPSSLSGNTYVASYTLPAAIEDDVDYGLYTFTLRQTGGTGGTPATISIEDLTFLYNDPDWNEYDAQLLMPHTKPPVIPSTVDTNLDYGTIVAQDVFNRGTGDGQEIPLVGPQGVDTVDEIAVIVGIPTVQGEPNDFSANEFEKRALLGFAPVQSDGSFHIRVPANTPISWATLDQLDRGFVVKRSWINLRPGEQITNCVGCHQHRDITVETNPNPIAATLPATDLNIPPANYRFITYRDHIGPMVASKCVSCHQPTYTTDVPPDTIPPAGDLDLTAVPDTTMEDQIFPRGYVNLSGESEMGPRNVTVPAFPRRSPLIDYVLGVGENADQHHDFSMLNASEQELFNLWVMLGAQYR